MNYTQQPPVCSAPTVGGRPASPHTRDAFTLIELLICIGIISVLIGILVPCVTEVRRAGYKVVCASNLRQLGFALTAYSTQWRYYPGCQHFEGFGNPRTFAVWPTRLRPYLSGSPSRPQFSSVLTCPAGDPAVYVPSVGLAVANAKMDAGLGYIPGEPLLQVDRTNVSYGYNDWGTGPNGASDAVQTGLGGDINYPLSVDGYGRELHVSRVRRPAEMIAMADVSASADFNFSIDPIQVGQRPAPVHHRGANVLFVDGHVVWMEVATLVNVDSNQADGAIMNRIWNCDNQIHSPTEPPHPTLVP